MSLKLDKSKLQVFETVPDLYLILSPDLIILNASNAYLEATFTLREHLVGKHIFEAFPDNPEHVDADGVSKVRSSLEHVLKHKTPHKMEVQRYDVPRPAHLGPGFEEKFWYPIHTPILNANNEVEYIIQKVVDITQEVQREAEYKSFVKKSAQQIEQAVSSKNQIQLEREKLYSLFMQAPAIIAVLTGPEHVFELANPRYRELVGIDRQIIGKPVREALPETEGQGFFELLDQVYGTGIPFQGTETPMWLDDPNTGQLEQRYLDFIYQPLLDDFGQTQSILAFIVDVTEKVAARQRAAALQAELLANAQRLIQERETFYQIFEMTPAAICIQRGPEHRFEYINAAYQAFFPGRPLLGLPVADALPETVTGGFVKLLDQVYRTGETYFGHESPLLVMQPNGKPPKEMYFTFTYQVYRENSQIVGISTFAYDVTLQVQARQQQEVQQKQLQVLFEQAPVAIAIFRNPEYVIEVANPRVAALWGRTPDQLLGKPLFEALPEVRDQGFRELLDEVVRSGTPFVANEVMAMLQRNGRLEEVYLNFVYQPLQDEQGQVMSVAAVATEVGEQVASRQQLAQVNQELTASVAQLDEANQQLTRTNVDLDNFIYTASHDLKAPILNIDGLMEALQDQLSPESLQDEDVQFTLHLMRDSVQRFKRTIDHLTEVTKLQKENSAEATLVDLATVITDVQLDLTTIIEATQARIEVDVSNCPTIRFSNKNLRSIIYNLLSNAIKYHSPTRTPLIQIHCAVTEEYQVLTVIDNGLGMDLSGKNKLFTMFKRLHNHVEGSGIGLYMVKKMIENAGGKIQVQSTVDKGSSFQVYLRRNKQEAS